MRDSARYGLKAAAWTLLQVGFIFLLFYALSGKFWMALLCVVLVLLAGNAANRSQALLSLSRQHHVRERMEDLKE